MADSRRCSSLVWASAGLGAALTVAACVLLRLGMLPLGIVGQWIWPLRQYSLAIQPATAAGFVIAVGAAVYVLHLVMPHRMPKRDQLLIGLLLCCLTAFGLMTGLFLAEPHPFVRAAQASCATHALPYYEQAMSSSSVGELLRGYGDFAHRQSLPDRLRTHPPGQVVYFYYARLALFSSPALVRIGGELLRAEGITPEQATALLTGYTARPLTGDDVVVGLLSALILTLSGCAIPALLAIVARSLADTRTALLAALLSATIPSVLLFVPSIDGLGVVLGLSALASYLWAVRRGSRALAALSGLLWAATFFWSIGLLFLALPAAGVLWYRVRSPQTDRPPYDAEDLSIQTSDDDGSSLPSRNSPRRAIAITVGVLLVFVASLTVLYMASGYNAAANVAEIMRVQSHIMGEAGRDRLTWLVMNIYEFALFMGPMLLVTSLAGLGCALSRRRQVTDGDRATDGVTDGVADGATDRAPSGRILGYFGTGLLLAFALLDISGSTRGEVGRIWVFLMPLFALFSAAATRHLPRRWWPVYIVPVVVAQAVYAYCLLATIVPVQPY